MYIELQIKRNWYRYFFSISNLRDITRFFEAKTNTIKINTAKPFSMNNDLPFIFLKSRIPL